MQVKIRVDSITITHGNKTTKIDIVCETVSNNYYIVFSLGLLKSLLIMAFNVLYIPFLSFIISLYFSSVVLYRLKDISFNQRIGFITLVFVIVFIKTLLNNLVDFLVIFFAALYLAFSPFFYSNITLYHGFMPATIATIIFSGIYNIFKYIFLKKIGIKF